MNPVEERLVRAGHGLAVGTSDVAPAVRARLESAPRPAARRQRLVAAAVVALLVASVLTFSPAARQAVAGLLGFDVLPVLRVAEQPAGPSLDRAALGRRVTLAGARRLVDFPFRVPHALGRPDEVRVDTTSVPGGEVTLLWRTPDTVVLLSALPGRTDEGFLGKSAGPGTRVSAVDVSGSPGWWLEGSQHLLAYWDEEGNLRKHRTRLAGDVLLWREGEVLYRVESARSLAEARRIAQSMR